MVLGFHIVNCLVPIVLQICVIIMGHLVYCDEIGKNSHLRSDKYRLANHMDFCLAGFVFVCVCPSHVL
jgi:hypothetical protein